MIQWAKQKYDFYICSIQTLLRYLRYMFYVMPQPAPTIELLHTLMQEIIQEEEYTYQTYFGNLAQRTSMNN